MPFVTQEHRDKPDMSIPGDRCFVYYKQMVSMWKAEPRWTTADTIWKNMAEYKTVMPEDHYRAMELAWQVFFIKYVMPYEDKKEAENGTI